MFSFKKRLLHLDDTRVFHIDYTNPLVIGMPHAASINSLIVQMWSVILASIAGVTRNERWTRQKL